MPRRIVPLTDEEYDEYLEYNALVQSHYEELLKEQQREYESMDHHVYTTMEDEQIADAIIEDPSLKSYFDKDDEIREQNEKWDEEKDEFLRNELRQLNSKPNIQILDSTSLSSCTPSMRKYVQELEQQHGTQLYLIKNNKDDSYKLGISEKELDKLLLPKTPMIMLSLVTLVMGFFIGYLLFQIFFNGQ